MAAHQALPSLGFSRQEHWSGLPFPSPKHESEKWKWIRSVMSESSWPHGLQPTRLLLPWDFPGKSTGVGSHCLLQKNSLVFPILLFTSISFHWSLRTTFLSLLAILWNTACQMGMSTFLLCLLLLFFSQLFVSLLRQSFCLFAFLFLGDGFGHWLLYNVMNLHP